ncbi:ABC transporter substrate-binding protein [Halorussus litoreus]|uniref:ABC transporter substrate-binding protein n=1 Tax=Halorussus litoreus TaxID=1710536 RepID=UPI000E23D4CB|nr:extracellular solute-binding protein [Halorussus litoreus]
MKRRQFIAATGVAGLAGLSGYANRQDGGTYLEQAQEIGFAENWRARRLDVADDWPIEARRDVPDRENDQTFQGTETFETAPWEPPEGWQDTAAGDVDTLQILNHGAANMEFDPATLATHELFEEKTGITIEPIEIGVDQANLQEQQFLSARQGEPHVMNVDGPLTPVFVQQGYLEVVDPLYTDEMWDAYIPALRSMVEWDIDSTREGTHQYGFPNIAEATVGNLRTNLVEEQGIDPSRFDGEWSWDLLEETMEAFEGTDVFGYAYYAGNPVYLFYSFRQLLYQQGGQIVADDGTVQIDTQPARTVLQKMVEWRENNWVPQEVISYGEGDLVDLFLAGRLAYVDAFADFVPRALNQYEADSEYRAVVPPMANTGPNPQQAALVAPNTTAINPFADDAQKLAGLLYGDLRLSYPSQWWEFTFEGNMSFMDRVYDDAEAADFVQFGDVLGSAIDRGVLEFFPQQQAIFQRLADPFQSAIVGDISPAEATQRGQQFIDSVLGQ